MVQLPAGDGGKGYPTVRHREGIKSNGDYKIIDQPADGFRDKGIAWGTWTHFVCCTQTGIEYFGAEAGEGRRKTKRLDESR